MLERKAMLAAAIGGLIAIVTVDPALAATDIPNSPAPTAMTVWDELASAVATREEMLKTSNKTINLMVEGMAADPNLVDLELTYPGLFDAFKASLLPIVRSEVDVALPHYHAELSALYKANLSESETQEILESFRTPEMQRFRKGVLTRLNPQTTVHDLISSNDVSTESLQSDLTLAAGKTALHMDANDRTKLTAFFRSPTGMKFNSLSPRKLEIDAKWANYVSPESEDTIESVVIDAMVAHIAKTDAKFAIELRKQIDKQTPSKP